MDKKIPAKMSSFAGTEMEGESVIAYQEGWKPPGDHNGTAMPRERMMTSPA